jgi:hypothetical protein
MEWTEVATFVFKRRNKNSVQLVDLFEYQWSFCWIILDMEKS